MNDGLKILGWAIGIFMVIAIAGCIWDNCHPRGLPKYLAHCEIHIDRDLAECILEQASEGQERDYEREADQAAQDCGLGTV